VARDDERLNTDIDALAHTFTELKSMLAAIEREESRSTEEKNLAVQEIHELEAEKTAHTERVAAMRTEMDGARQAEAEAQQCVSDRELELAAREQTLAELKQKLADIERDSATWRERFVALEREAQSLSSQQSEKRDEAEREQARADAIEERVRVSAAALAEKDRTRSELSDLIDIHTMNVQSLTAQKDEARAAFDAARGREREIATELETARGELSAVREREVNLRVRLESKLEQSRSEFQLDALAELTTRGGPPTFEAAQEEGEEAAEAAEQRIAKAQELVQTLEKRLANLGPVNMYALDEMQELEKRHSFLHVQHEDLESARASLRDVIARINRRSRSLFQETFEAVKGQFNEIFRKLFGGGKADLILEEGEDILEAGIEILARPPGKEPRGISLLSGGEKTMTMIALLFAVFRSRPAPFCILDEVDAPLDEANVDRFNQIVREFMDKSQFVIVTHNKKSMSYADILYGITMPEPGVSKRIAIKFSEIEKHLPMDEINKQAEKAREASIAQAEAARPADAPVEEAVTDATPAAAETHAEAQLEEAVGGGE
jgi:chromosome segregation protein